MSEKYEDMLYLEPPVSKIHRKMSISERAAQFMPFAALTGYEDLKNIGKINLFSKNVKASQVQKEDQQYSISKLMAFGELTLQSIEKLLELLIFIFAIYLVLKNELTIGTIASVSTYTRHIFLLLSINWLICILR